jgi:hypothetical protein
MTLLALLRRTNWTTRPGIPGAVMSVVLAVSVATTACQSGGPVSNAHANEPFCKAMATQVEAVTQFVKPGKDNDPNHPDMARATKYFTDAKELNATLVKTAPASLEMDVALQTKNANAMIDAQLSRDTARINAASDAIGTPENLAAGTHMGEYCGYTIPTPK